MSTTPTVAPDYSEDEIKTLNWREHIRLRPGMYIGRTGDGSNPDDGIYILLKEVIDNSIDEFVMGYGKDIVIDITEGCAIVRDFGRGIPLGKIVDVASKINTGAKYGSAAFSKSGGMNGVGIKAVNAVSTEFRIMSVRDGQMKQAVFSKGEILEESDILPTSENNGTLVMFKPDNDIFKGYKFNIPFVVSMIKAYVAVNKGLTIVFNGEKYQSRNGLIDLVNDNMVGQSLYGPICLKGPDIEIVITHSNQYGEEYYSFANGQNTVQGGTHLSAFREAICRTVREFFRKDNMEYSDIRNGIIGAISIRLEEGGFESQTKTKLTSRDMSPNGPTVLKFVSDFVSEELDSYLHRNPKIADIILKKIKQNERDRKSMAGLSKKAKEATKKLKVFNDKLFDCNAHLCDKSKPQELREASSIFLTEGNSAAGSITKIRDVKTQAVYALRGKVLNVYKKTKAKAYETEELVSLVAALDVDDDIEKLRYNKIIIATDADDDGKHIRLLLITFFLWFFPRLIRTGHVYVLETPLFRVRNKKNAHRRNSSKSDKDIYCYNEDERLAAIAKVGPENAEITRFKGLGEISPDEFKGFIGDDIRLTQVQISESDNVAEILKFYMGDNSNQRRDFIVENLVVEGNI